MVLFGLIVIGFTLGGSRRFRTMHFLEECLIEGHTVGHHVTHTTASDGGTRQGVDLLSAVGCLLSLLEHAHALEVAFNKQILVNKQVLERLLGNAGT